MVVKRTFPWVTCVEDEAEVVAWKELFTKMVRTNHYLSFWLVGSTTTKKSLPWNRPPPPPPPLRIVHGCHVVGPSHHFKASLDQGSRYLGGLCRPTITTRGPMEWIISRPIIQSNQTNFSFWWCWCVLISMVSVQICWSLEMIFCFCC